MSFTVRELMIDVLPARLSPLGVCSEATRNEEDDELDCSEATRAGGKPSVSRSRNSDLALLRGRLREALEAQA